MKKCVVCGKPTRDELCNRCKDYFRKRYKNDPVLFEHVMKYFRKHPYPNNFMGVAA